MTTTDDVLALLLCRYQHTRGDEIISVGHWESPADRYGMDVFKAQIEFTVAQLRHMCGQASDDCYVPAHAQMEQADFWKLLAARYQACADRTVIAFGHWDTPDFWLDATLFRPQTEITGKRLRALLSDQCDPMEAQPAGHAQAAQEVRHHV